MKVVLLLCSLVTGFVLPPKNVNRNVYAVIERSSTNEPIAEKIEKSSSVKLTIPVSGAATKAAFKAAASELARSRPIPGWRAKDAEKIPASVVAREIGPEIVKAKAIEALSETEVHGAISRLSIPAVGQARFLEAPKDIARDFEPGSPFTLCVCVDVWPEEVLWSEPYDTPFEITVERTESDQSVRAQAMDALCERYALKSLPESESYQAKFGDAATVDMKPFELLKNDEDKDKIIKGEPMNLAIGGDNLELILEEGKFLPGVAEAIIGLKVGDFVDVPVAFPENMPREKSLAGKTVIFQIELKKIELRRIPSPEEVATTMLNTTLDGLERQIDETVSAAQKQAGTDNAADADDVNREIEKVLAQRVAQTHLPDAMVTEACRQKFAVMLADMRSRGTPDADIQRMISSEGFEKYKKVTLPQVQDELRTKLAVQYIAKDRNIKLEQAEIDDQLAQVKAQYKDSTIDDEKAIEKISDELTRIKVCDFIRENYATINIKTIAPDEFPEKQQTASVA